MTLGEKIKKYRSIFNLLQESLAEKINVSRQAITKWENDDGIPEIMNLKELASIFNVSVDYLSGDTKQVEYPLLRESNIRKNNFSTKYDYVLDYLKTNYANDTIYVLTELKKEKKLFNTIDFLSLRAISFVEWLSNPAVWFIIEKKTGDLIAKATKEYIEIRELPSKVDTDSFVFDNTKLMKIKKRVN